MKTYFNSRQEKDFILDVVSETLLEYSVEYIRNNFTPDEIFPQEELEQWAEENNYIKEEQ